MSSISLGADTLLHVLLDATSSNADRLASANKQLEHWEVEWSIWRALIDVAFQANLDLSNNAVALQDGGDLFARALAVRTVAMIRFKNGTERFWRSRVVDAGRVTIAAEEKNFLRERLWACLDEPDRTIALQASITITRLARFDFPHQWPSLFQDLMSRLSAAHASLAQAPSYEHQRAARLTLLRGADVLARTLKEMGSVKMLSGKIRMTELANNMLEPLQHIFHQLFEETFPTALVQAGDSEAAILAWASTDQLPERVRTSQLFLRAVMHLILADPGMITSESMSEGGNRPNVALGFFQSTPVALERLTHVRNAYLRLYGAASSAEQAAHLSLLTTLYKHLMAFGKLYLALLAKERSKASLWHGWSQLVQWYWAQACECADETLSLSQDEAASPRAFALQHPPRFIVQSLLLLKRSISDWANYQPAPFNDAAWQTHLADTLVSRLMKLTQDDLARWDADPEEWAGGEENEAIDADVRPAAERALMVLVTYAKPVREHLWNRFVASESLPCGANAGATLDDILARDAVYAAIGRCRDYMPKGADLARAAGERLVREASLGHEAGASWLIIRRRIAWILWEWSEHISIPYRPAVYAVLVNLLEDAPGVTDVAVRLAAARSLGALADTLEFDADSFEPFVEHALSRLANLVVNADLNAVDSVRMCTTALSILTERIGARVVPHIEALAGLVPQLWSVEDPQFLNKSSIITFVGKLVRSVEMVPFSEDGPAVKLHGLVEPLVRQSLSDPAAASILGKEALSLWIRSLHSSGNMSAPLFSLLDLIPTLITQPDFCHEACRVVEEVALLTPQELLVHHGAALFNASASLIADPNSALIISPVSAIEVLVQGLSAVGASEEQWPLLMDQSGLFAAVVRNVINSIVSERSDSVMVAGHSISLLARLAIASPTAFLALLRSAALKLGHATPSEASTHVVKPLLQQWCKLFENMSSARRRKVTALGLASLLQAADPTMDADVLETVPEMISIWTDMLGEINDRGETESTIFRSSAMAIGGAISDDGDWLEDVSPGSARANALADLDPAVTTRMSAAVSSALNIAQGKAGPALLSSVDELVLDMLRADLAAE